jgi:hypothetical protein
VDLAVQVKGESRTGNSSDCKEDSPANRSRTARSRMFLGVGNDTLGGLFKLGKNFVNVLASRGIGVRLVSRQTSFAFGSFFNGFLAKLEDLNVFVIVSVVVIIIVGVFVNSLAGDAPLGNDGTLSVRQRLSVVEGFEDALAFVLGWGGATIIQKDRKVDVKSVGADRSDIVLLVHVDTIVVIVIIVVSIGTFQLLIFNKRNNFGWRVCGMIVNALFR